MVLQEPDVEVPQVSGRVIRSQAVEKKAGEGVYLMIRQSFNDNWSFRKGADGLFRVPGKMETVTLPHDAMILEKRDKNCRNGASTGFYPGGTYTYSKRFFLGAEDADKDIFLEFEGVYMNAAVLINGDLAGTRPNGYSNFFVKANDFLKYGQENEIKVVVKTENMPNTRWYSGSGIYRDVNLLKANTLHVVPDGLRITTLAAEDGLAVLEIAASIENTARAARSMKIATVIRDATGTVVASAVSAATAFAGDAFTVRQRVTVTEPRRWDVDAPHLYTCSCNLEEDGTVVDETTETFGIRTLEVDAARGLRINGRTVKLRGGAVHHDSGVLGVCTFERAEERRVEILKQAGFNAIRSAHNPLSKVMLRACDRLGMFVMDEFSDMWQAPKADYDYALVFGEWWEKDVEAMVAKDYNHPCVILYSIGNEIIETVTKHGARLSRTISDKFRSLDPTRFTTQCLNGFLSSFPHVPEIMRELAANGLLDLPESGSDEIPASEIHRFMTTIEGRQAQIAESDTVAALMEETFDGVDIAGYNYMVGRYESDRTRYPNRVIVGSETCPPDVGTIWKKVMANTHVIGDFCWTGWDYLGEAGSGTFSYDENPGFAKPYPVLLSYFGDIDITGHRRPMSYYREIAYGIRKDPYIAVQRVDRHGRKVYKNQWCGNDTIASWTWPGYEGKPAIVEVFSNAQEVELLLDGRSLGRNKVLEDPMYTAVFETVYQPGRLEAVSYADGIETGRMVLASAEETPCLTVDVDRTRLKADGADLSYLMISITDTRGVVNMSKPLPVTVSVEGAGALQGFGSADPLSTEHFHDTTRTTYDGRVLAVVRALHEAGDIMVSISAPGCEPVAVALQAG